MSSPPAQPLTPHAWRCPGCGYELTGLAGPVCPECGIDAVAEHERRRALREARLQRVFSWPPEGLLVLAFVFALTQPVARASRPWHADDPAILPLLGVWTLGGVWLWYRRARVFVHARLAWLLPYVALLVFTSWMSLQPRWRWDDRYDLRLTGAVLSVSTALTAVLWVCTKGRSWRALLLMLGLLVTAPGVALSWLANWHFAAGSEWSPLSDPRPGQVHAQYPLRWDEVWSFVPVVLLTGAALLIGALVAPSRRRGSIVRITRCPASPHHPPAVSSLTSSSPPPSPSPSPPGSSRP